MPLYPSAGAEYVTGIQARAAGAKGDDATLAPLISEARDRIDAFTGDTFTPLPMTVVARVARDGSALLPRRPVTVTDVRPVGAPTGLAPSAYRVLSSAILGQVDAVILGGASVSDPLVAGAEPWNGGYRQLLFGGGQGTGQVQVTGTFGHVEVPPVVRSAAAAIVVALQAPTAQAVDDEGNVVSITDTAPAPSRSTGSPVADALLAPYVRTAGTRIS